jgi:phospholipid/cholesterol/gamma-HCH transport system substrate-binding protein
MAAMVIFAFSCFGLLLFLWLSFGGPIPLKPKGYRVAMAFPEATTLATQADVRVAGVSVGKVTKLETDPKGNRTLATVEIDRAYAPLHEDSRAMLRQKTLLGETYVELTLGHKSTPTIPEDGQLKDARVAPTVELDEVLKLFPEKTRDDFRRWQANSAEVIEGRSGDLSAALASLGPFAQSGDRLLAQLERRPEELKALVDQTGVVFEALTRDEDGLRAFIGDTAKWFRATASERERLSESIRIFPTFLRESRLTLRRIEDFSVNTRPLVEDLGPVARDLQPTLVDLREASPDLRRVFTALPVLTRQSRTGLPAMSRTLRGLRPVLSSVSPFLAQLNPILSFLELNEGIVSNFLAVPGWALSGKAVSNNPQSQGHILPQLVVAGSQSFIAGTRTADNRGNAYLKQESLAATDEYAAGYNIQPTWDCANAGGEKKADDTPGCLVQGPFTFQGKTEKYPHVLESRFNGETK